MQGRFGLPTNVFDPLTKLHHIIIYFYGSSLNILKTVHNPHTDQVTQSYAH